MPPDGTYYTCEDCLYVRLSDAPDPQYCPPCRNETDTVLRWIHSNNIIVWSPTLGKNITVAAEWEKGWRCVRCQVVQDYLLNGCPGSDGCLRGVCRQCRAHADFVYVNRREGWCCGVCRSERLEGFHQEVGRDGEEGKVFAEWCDNCDEITSTARVDPGQEEVWVCAGCCAECEEPDWNDEYAASECGHCGQETFTVEIGSG